MEIRPILVKRDDQLLQIEAVIHAKRKMLLDKQKNLLAIAKQNEFLDVVKQDYAKYYQFISQQKSDQIKALELLNTYIKDLTVSGALSQYNIEDAKVEQKKILHEVSSIRKGLDDIIRNTNDIQNSVGK